MYSRWSSVESATNPLPVGHSRLVSAVAAALPMPCRWYCAKDGPPGAMMAAMLKSVAFPLSPFVGIPPRAPDDTLIRYAFSPFSLSNDLCVLARGLPHRSRNCPPSLSSSRKSRAKINTLTRDEAYQATVGTLVPSACPLLTTSPSFYHQAFVRVNMMIRNL